MLYVILDIELFVRFNGTAGIMMPTTAVRGDIQICSCLYFIIKFVLYGQLLFLFLFLFSLWAVCKRAKREKKEFSLSVFSFDLFISFHYFSIFYYYDHSHKVS